MNKNKWIGDKFMKNYVITFENTHTAMDGESVLKKKGNKTYYNSYTNIYN